ncbi:type II toxin-antitoxin system VapC family toxin [Streptomyces sp. NPDC001492]
MPELTAVTFAELQQGVAMAKDPAVRAARMEKLGAAVADFEPLPFDGDAAARYGTLVALTIAANRDPRPRRMDLMIAAIASARGLPLFTRNAGDFKGLESAVLIVPV